MRKENELLNAKAENGTGRERETERKHYMLLHLKNSIREKDEMNFSSKCSCSCREEIVSTVSKSITEWSRRIEERREEWEVRRRMEFSGEQKRGCASRIALLIWFCSASGVSFLVFRLQSFTHEKSDSEIEINQRKRQSTVVFMWSSKIRKFSCVGLKIQKKRQCTVVFILSTKNPKNDSALSLSCGALKFENFRVEH